MTYRVTPSPVGPLCVMPLRDYRRGRAVTLLVGAMFGVLALVLVLAILPHLVPSIAPAPAIVRQDDNATEARIVTRRGGERIVCTVTIDHRSRGWTARCPEAS